MSYFILLNQHDLAIVAFFIFLEFLPNQVTMNFIQIKRQDLGHSSLNSKVSKKF